MRKQLFMTKADAINELKKVNNDIKVSGKSTIKELNAIASGENVYPPCITSEYGLIDTFISMVHAYGYKVYYPKKGGVVAKQGRKRVFELYNVSDNRIHLYAYADIIDPIKKGKYKGFLTENDRWCYGSRFEFTRASWLQFVSNYFEIKR